MPDEPITLDFYEIGDHNRVAHWAYKGIHLTVEPVLEGRERKAGSALLVSFWGSKDGKIDTIEPLKSNAFEGGPEDLEEVALLFAQRLQGGTKPKEMFYDTYPEDKFVIKRLSEEPGGQKK